MGDLERVAEKKKITFWDHFQLQWSVLFYFILFYFLIEVLFKLLVCFKRLKPLHSIEYRIS